MKAEHRELLEQLRPARGVLIVDDHPGFRRCARTLLVAEGFDVVGEAPDGTAALALAADLKPELVLLDIQLPDIDGFEVARRLLEDDARVQIVLVSSDDSRAQAPPLDASRVRGFLLKEDLTGAALERLLE